MQCIAFQSQNETHTCSINLNNTEHFSKVVFIACLHYCRRKTSGSYIHNIYILGLSLQIYCVVQSQQAAVINPPNTNLPSTKYQKYEKKTKEMCYVKY